MTITGLIRRLALIRGYRDGLTDKTSGLPPSIPRGNGCGIQCGLFVAAPSEATLVTDFTGVASVTVQFRKDGPLGAALFDVTVPIEEINTGLTWAQWQADTHSHFSFLLTADDHTNQDLAGKTSLPIYYAFQVNLVGADPVFCGFAKTEIFEDGVGSSGTPTPGDPTYLTAAEARAEFAAAADSDRVLHLTGLTGGGSTKLDGVVTAGLSVPRVFTVIIGDTIATYLLRAGTEAEAAPGIIRPDDYNAGTNAKIFILLS